MEFFFGRANEIKGLKNVTEKRINWIENHLNEFVRHVIMKIKKY